MPRGESRAPSAWRAARRSAARLAATTAVRPGRGTSASTAARWRCRISSTPRRDRRALAARGVGRHPQQLIGDLRHGRDDDHRRRTGASGLSRDDRDQPADGVGIRHGCPAELHHHVLHRCACPFSSLSRAEETEARRRIRHEGTKSTETHEEPSQLSLPARRARRAGVGIHGWHQQVFFVRLRDLRAFVSNRLRRLRPLRQAFSPASPRPP